MKYLVLIITGFVLLSCGNYDRSSRPSIQTKASTTIDFATIKSEFLQKQCIECHDPENYHRRYENYSAVKAAIPKILERIKSSDPGRRMPKNMPALDPEKIKLFEEWVAGGAPEFTDQTKQSEPIPPVNFSQVKQVLKQNNCIACHAQYQDYASVRRSIDGIVNRVSISGPLSMPFPKSQGGKTVPVPADQIKLLEDWLAQGSPEVAGQAIAELPPIKLEPTYKSLRNHVFGPKCTICHNTYGSRGVGFQTYDALRDWEERRIKKGRQPLFDDPDNQPGLFLESVLRDPDDEFSFESAMPYNDDPNDPFSDDVDLKVAPLTEQEIEVLKQWIRLGLPSGLEEE